MRHPLLNDLDIKEQRFQQLSDLLFQHDLNALPPHHFFKIDRKLGECEEHRKLKIALLGNTVTDILAPFVKVYAARSGFLIETYHGAYNQYFQEVLDPDSGLYQFQPDIVLLFLELRSIAPDIYNSYTSLKTPELSSARQDIVDHISNWYNALNRHLSASIFISNFTPPPFFHYGVADTDEHLHEGLFYNRLNQDIFKLTVDNPRFFIFDLDKIVHRYGSINAFDPKMYYLAKVAWTQGFLKIIAEEIERWLVAIQGKTRKCLILDLDNTLWGGVVGEEGPSGIRIGAGDPTGEAYLQFQHNIKSLKSRGIMLAICSKNNESDVIEAFNSRTEMPLSLADFAAYRINWDHKHVNIQSMSKELNIGLDSMVFIDDNPVECSLIRQMLPMVKTIQLSSEPDEIPSTIDRTTLFEKSFILEDDRYKTDQYIQNRERINFKNDMGDLNSFLNSLQTQISICQPQQGDINRIHQLYTKTNQFNVTTKRYSVGEIETFLNDQRHDLTIISASDRFGNLGVIGLFLIKKNGHDSDIDSFILSCRAMGRGIETSIMNYIKAKYLDQKETHTLKAHYRPTPKNIPVASFFEEQGFTVTDNTDKGEKRYEIASENSELLNCDWINIIN